MCGGTTPFRPAAPTAPGLSPRVRGNHTIPLFRHTELRSIPACAGEPVGRNCNLYSIAVYPRVCGGTRPPLNRSPSRTGLSPRVRGNRDRPQPARARLGSIPACAGEPRQAFSISSFGEVYPRVCGGTSPPPPRRAPATGLSPRVRGNQKPGLPVGAGRGSIPACAGEPPRGRPAPPSSGVYPRVCGGTPRPAGRRSRRGGLSPRVRGNHAADGAARHGGGSIPACAGEPPAQTATRSRSGVYPRVCGGTSAASTALAALKGLSPRVRGNLSAGQ